MAHDLENVGDIDVPPESHWHAELELRIELSKSDSLLQHCRHLGPLRVQRPFYPEGPEVCHICILHPPGGLVSGDHLTIDVAVGPGARALVTTPAAAKFYRSDGRRAVLRQRLSVADGGVLEWLPQETIVFDGARASTETSVALDRGAAFVGWEIQCLGRPAVGERYGKGDCRSRFEIHRDGVPLYVDCAAWKGGSEVLSARYGLGGNCAFGTMFAVGAPEALSDAFRTLAASPPHEFVSATLLAAGNLLCCRYVGPSASCARERFADVWRVVRPRVLGRVAMQPRIWAT